MHGVTGALPLSPLEVRALRSLLLLSDHFDSIDRLVQTGRMARETEGADLKFFFFHFLLAQLYILKFSSV